MKNNVILSNSRYPLRKTFSQWLPLFVCVLILLFSLPCIAESQNTKSEKTRSENSKNKTDSLPPSPLPIETLQEFSRAFAQIKNQYVEEIDDKTILTNAIKGMLSGLDPHSSYLDIDSFKSIKEGTTGEFSGLGMEVGMEDGFIKIISPIDDTPAQRAGIKAGDLIIRIEGKTTRGMSLDDAIKIMRGKPGTKISISVLHEGDEDPVDIVITREIITVSSVKSKLIEKNYGYIRISSFQSRTVKQIRKHYKKLLKKNNDKKLKGFILDLRNNPGGILNGAVEVSNLFLEKGIIVYTKGRAKDSQLKFSATLGDLVEKTAIVVLVNEGSASASEIVAGALQDHKRAVIMGNKTFGKGSVQTILPMSEKTAIKLTTARYFTPSGRSIQAEGITPDITIEKWNIEKQMHQDYSGVKEADLKGSLKNTSHKKKESKKGSSINKEQSFKDYALHEAINLLKGLNVLRAQ